MEHNFWIGAIAGILLVSGLIIFGLQVCKKKIGQAEEDG